MTIDWTPIIVAAIVALPPTVFGILNHGKLTDIHLSLNSRLDQLVKASSDSGRQAERDAHTITVQGVPKPEE
jgi:hypothetical protein